VPRSPPSWLMPRVRAWSSAPSNPSCARQLAWQHILPHQRMAPGSRLLPHEYLHLGPSRREPQKLSLSSSVLGTGYIWRNKHRAPARRSCRGVGMWETRRVFQALREQSGMSTPIHAELWIPLGVSQRLTRADRRRESVGRIPDSDHPLLPSDRKV